MDPVKIAESFGLTDVVEVSGLRVGHINRTYCIACSSGRYILQSLNRDIFTRPEIIMSNISLIEQAFRGEEDIAIPHYLSCGGRNYAELDGEIWRIYRYIEECSQAGNRSYAHGYAVGRFLMLVNSGGFEFGTPIDLHEFRLDLPLRNIHGDTKADNIIFGRKTAVIDFDTSMRGYICADYGDMIRSVTTKGFDIRIVQEVTEGFADGLGGLLAPEEIDSLYTGIVLITEELAGRYHGGNKNFPNKTPEQCFERENELKLQLKKIKEHQTEIEEIIRRCFE